MKTVLRRSGAVGVMILVVTSCGCGVFRWIAGTSLARLEDEKTGRFTHVLPFERTTAFALVTGVVDYLGVVTYLEDEEDGYLITMGYDRLFPRAIDTTEVGYFFTETAADQTALAIVSLNNDLARFVSVHFAYYLLEPRRNDFDALTVATDAETLREILRGLLTEQNSAVVSEGDDYLVCRGVEVRGQVLDEDIVMFFESTPDNRTRLRIASLDTGVLQEFAPAMEKKLKRSGLNAVR
ncbi:MAG TPA: hypothetical protein PK636_09395 [bacterium]|nr:hypothetical protein [bacterium]HPJ72887.1 hypothetical protein [bacterium]HPQ65463.1 hypothetical protein [bacterium]